MRAPLIAVLLLTLTLVGCSAPDTGWTTVEAGQLRLERPTRWTPTPSQGDVWTLGFAGDGVELRIAPQFSEDPTAAAAFSRLDLPSSVGTLDDYTGGGLKRFPVEGADTGVRADLTYRDGEKTLRGIWIIAGQYPYPRTVAITLSGEQLPDETVQRILGSLRFSKKAG